MIDGVTTYGSTDLIEEIQHTEPVFICTIGTTETSRIEGISGAGATPELTEYTPAADVELMVLGQVRCMEEIAQTVIGEAAAPTPAVLTKAALELADIPFVIVDAGSKIKPEIECMRLGNDYGRDIRTGKGVLNPLEIYENGKDLGEKLGMLHDSLIIGESIAAGTTTALGVLKALGYDADGKVSGCMPTNPHDLKTSVVDEGIKNSGIEPGKCDAFQAIGAVGDPTLAGIAALVLSSGNTPIILAGGTQMAAVCAVVKAIKPDFDFSRVNIATTIYVAEDETANLLDLLNQIDPEISLHVVDPKFEESEDPGIRLYTEGFIKEGAGAGGAMFTALMRGASVKSLRSKIEKVCQLK
ncbi:MAG: TIGR00303 family protein [Methanobrevibacter sp.]|uniref:nicotinate mononucleotide-dependent phosphoribosyltransferase CobT n=1 Tax=Methanobrevibacter sp. TaxID=66852 RepID=UPI0026DF6A02|nr:TIGR00303 family protein [Methanobrevibacter sp.]MDO5847950.1 TIGR00303 family protein [Methanobrevibacter sp.]